MKVDYKIRKILHLLSNNSRATTKEIAKEIKTSQQNASYLISKLKINKKDDLINSFKLLIDSSRFGYNNFLVFLRLKKYSKSEINSFINELKKYKEVIGIDLLFGKYDLLIKFSSPNPSNFNKIHINILNKFSENIFDYLILTQVVLYFYPSNYLSKKSFDKKIIISGDREIINISLIEKKIINLLNTNSRINYSHIANNLNTTSKTIISKIKNLEKKNIIKGYSININHHNLNINKYYLFLKFDIKVLDENKRFIQYTKNNPNIVEFIKIFGEYNAILIIETLKENEFKEILFIIKEEFSDIITDYEFLESKETKIWKYLPEFEEIEN